GFLRDAVAIRASPLRPIGSRGCQAEQDAYGYLFHLRPSPRSLPFAIARWQVGWLYQGVGLTLAGAAAVSGRLVRSDLSPEADRQPVPDVDGRYRDGQVDQLFLVEMPAHGFVYGVWHLVAAYHGHGFGPFQRRAFAVREERGFPPDYQRVEALLGFAAGSRVLRVHVYAVGAAIHLRRAHLHQINQCRVEAGVVDITL